MSNNRVTSDLNKPSVDAALDIFDQMKRQGKVNIHLKHHHVIDPPDDIMPLELNEFFFPV